jgi:hypothetical protein
MCWLPSVVSVHNCTKYFLLAMFTKHVLSLAESESVHMTYLCVRMFSRLYCVTVLWDVALCSSAHHVSVVSKPGVHGVTSRRALFLSTAPGHSAYLPTLSTCRADKSNFLAITTERGATEPHHYIDGGRAHGGKGEAAALGGEGDNQTPTLHPHHQLTDTCRLLFITRSWIQLRLCAL